MEFNESGLSKSSACDDSLAICRSCVFSPTTCFPLNTLSQSLTHSSVGQPRRAERGRARGPRGAPRSVGRRAQARIVFLSQAAHPRAAPTTKRRFTARSSQSFRRGMRLPIQERRRCCRRTAGPCLQHALLHRRDLRLLPRDESQQGLSRLLARIECHALGISGR